MPDKRHWSAALAPGLANLAGRLDERHASVSARDAADQGTAPSVAVPSVVSGSESDPAAVRSAPAQDRTETVLPAQRTGPATDPVAVVPWSMRVAAEVGWRLLVLAGTVWV